MTVNLGPDRGNLPLSSWWVCYSFTVSGDTSGFGLSFSDNSNGSSIIAEYSINGAAFTSSTPTLVFNDQEITIRVKTASSNSSNVTYAVTIDGDASNISLTTEAGDPVGNSASNEVQLYRHNSPYISLREDIHTFFGPIGYQRLPYGNSVLTNYLRGARVPSNISANASVPSSVPIKLTDLIYAKNRLRLDSFSGASEMAWVAAGASGTFEVEKYWYISGQPGTDSVGNVYGSAPFHTMAEYRWTFILASSYLQDASVVVTVPGGGNRISNRHLDQYVE